MRTNLGRFASRLLVLHIMGRGSLSSTAAFIPAYGVYKPKWSNELTACVKAKDALVAEFCTYIRERDTLATPREFIRRWIAAIGRIGEITSRTMGVYTDACEHRLADRPFPVWMADLDEHVIFIAREPTEDELANIAYPLDVRR